MIEVFLIGVFVGVVLTFGVYCLVEWLATRHHS